MIYLFTGLPGNGKTLYTLWTVKQRAEKENRPVFYNGIAELKIESWTEFENPEDWHTLPDGAIIVIDEAQRAFRPRVGRGAVPAHVEQLETHRHHGFDIYLITQHPTLIENNVRRLAGTHAHVVRTFGMERSVIHEWGEVRTDCETNRRDSSKTVWPYPKEIYGLYKSATVHTHKRQVPKHVWYLGIALIALGLCIWFVMDGLGKASGGPKAGEGAILDDPRLLDSPGAVMPFAPDREKRPMTVKEYVEHYTPRIEYVPHSAPRYDEVTKPVEAPVIAGCIQSADTCRCYSQRGSPMPSSPDQCQAIVTGGVPFYDFTRPPAGPQQAAQRETPIASTQPVIAPPVAAATQPSQRWGGIAASDTWGGVR